MKTAKDVLKNVLDYEDNNALEFREWFLKQFEGTENADGCCVEEFSEYFLNAVRQKTGRHLKLSNGTDNRISATEQLEMNSAKDCQLNDSCFNPMFFTQERTPDISTTVTTTETPKSQNGAAPKEEPIRTPRRILLDLQQQSTSTPNNSCPAMEDSQISTGVQLSFVVSENGSSAIPLRVSTSADRSNPSQKHDLSTPIKTNTSNNPKRLSTTPTSSICLADFLVLNKSNNRLHKKKNTSGTQQSNQVNAPQEKPKKRVQPISVSKRAEMSAGNTQSVFAGESSFSNENNILRISHTELEDRDQCVILAARKTLKSNASEITKDLTDSPIKTSNMVTSSTPTKPLDKLTFDTEDIPLDLKNIEKNVVLRRLADIYVTLLDLSLTTNFLNELSYLLNILNASPSHPNTSLAEEFDRLELQNDEECSNSLDCLLDLSHAICFALLCLNQQKILLASLDLKTIKVIMNNGRFPYLKEDVRVFIRDIYERKQIIIAEHNTLNACVTTTKLNANVYFQQEQDSRQNFSSQREFINFRAQRDLFYKCLNLWETSHLNPNWKFGVGIGHIIREIFQQSELFINMARFAHLFVSQLLISSSNASSPEEIGLDVDMQKLSRLTQRLIAPSQFSVDYQFPRTQAFFRDFILNARSLAFSEQLKMTLFSELISLNDSSFEHISLTKTEDETGNQDISFKDKFMNDEMAVKPETLNSMLVLAKFLGFTISLPFTFNANNGNIVPANVEKEQIKVRTLIQPNFDLYSLVQVSIEEGKLLITIPWLVQYISMLDTITLQLAVHTKVLRLLFALHLHLVRGGANSLHSTSKFIITACLSWLFDSKQILTEQYYHYRMTQKTNPDEDLVEIKSKFEDFKQGGETSTKQFVLNPILEALLPVACPFLGEFRVSIMPAKYASTKYASRSGRYRHITTRFAELTPAFDNEEPAAVRASLKQTKATQKDLIEAFLLSQNASTRQMISFCSERCFKSVVRDGQINILLAAKSKADAEVNKITSSKFQVVYKEITNIYNEAHKVAFARWKALVPKMLDKRIKAALDSLLPQDTAIVLKKTYFMVIKNNAKQKISQWFYANIIKDNYFCAELETLANKVCTADKTKIASELIIVAGTPSVSELINSLQYWLHCTSVRTELFQDAKPVVSLLRSFNESFRNVLPTMMYHLLGAYVIQLLHNIISHKYLLLTDELTEAAMQLLLKVNTDLNLTNNGNDTTKRCIYGGLVSVAFLKALDGKSECYTRFGELVIDMIKADIITLSYANQLFVSILKYDWPSSQLNDISNLMKNISQATASVCSTTTYSNASEKDDNEDDDKSNLFMEMLADLSRDVELY